MEGGGRVPFEPLPLEVAVEVHGLLELAEGLLRQVALDDGLTGGEDVLAALVEPLLARVDHVLVEDLDQLVGARRQEAPVQLVGHVDALLVHLHLVPATHTHTHTHTQPTNQRRYPVCFIGDGSFNQRVRF